MPQATVVEIWALATQGLADIAHIMEIHDEWWNLEVAGEADFGTFPLEIVENDLHRILNQIRDTRKVFGQAAIDNCRYLADACATERRKVEDDALVRAMEATSLLPADHWDAESAIRAAERPALQAACQHRSAFRARFEYRLGERRRCDRCGLEGMDYLVHCRDCALRLCEGCRRNAA